MSEEKKQRLKEYQKNYYKTKKSKYNHEWHSFLTVIDIVILIITNKIVFFNWDLTMCTIKSIYSCHFRQTDRDKSLIMHN